MNQPVRIQRKRTKGWRMPENTISVTRPGKWGNPFKLGDNLKEIDKLLLLKADLNLQEITAGIVTRDVSIKLYNSWLSNTDEGVKVQSAAHQELKGKNLACFCSINDLCHGDILIKIANN
jgi:hypothetical protein